MLKIVNWLTGNYTDIPVEKMEKVKLVVAANRKEVADFKSKIQTAGDASVGALLEGFNDVNR